MSFSDVSWISRWRSGAVGAVFVGWAAVLIFAVGPMGSAMVTSGTCGMLRPIHQQQLAASWLLLIALTSVSAGLLWPREDSYRVQKFRDVGFGLMVCASFVMFFVGGFLAFISLAGPDEDAPRASGLVAAGWVMLLVPLSSAAFMSPRLLRFTGARAGCATALVAVGLSAIMLGTTALARAASC